MLFLNRSLCPKTGKNQAAAERTMESDATVQSLMAEFDGKLDAVKPVDPARQEQQ